MENSYINASECWKDLNRNLATFTKIASKRYLPPVSTLPTLQINLVLYLQKCLMSWEEIEICVHPNAPEKKKWAFDQIGNILRAALIQLQDTKSKNCNLSGLATKLKIAQELTNEVDKEFFWYTTVMIMPSEYYPFSKFRNPRNQLLNNPQLYLERNLRNRNLSKTREAEMSDYMPKLKKALEIHMENAAELRQYIAQNPFEPSLKSRYKSEVDSYRKLAKQLQAKGEKVDDKFFDEPPDNDKPKPRKISTPSKISEITNKTQETPFRQPSTDSKTKLESTMSEKGAIQAIRKILVEYLDLFKKDITIDAHEPLKYAIESKFEILLLRVNYIIDELERIGEESYDTLEIAKMLDMSIRRLRQQETTNKSKDVTKYLSVAIDMIDK